MDTVVQNNITQELWENSSLRYLKGIGPKREAAFNKLGVYTIKDLLYFFPFRYEDRRYFKAIKDLKLNDPCLVRGKILTVHLKRIPSRFSRHVKNIFEAIVTDGKNTINCVWFNQPFLAGQIKPGDEIIIYGKPTIARYQLQFVSPEYASLENEGALNIGKIVGVYRLTSLFTQKYIRTLMISLIDEYKTKLIDDIPFYIRKEKNLPNVVNSLEAMHFPSSWQEAEEVRERFIFEELFFSQILVYLRKARHCSQKGVPLKVNEAVIAKIRSHLPFQLTGEQNIVVGQICKDLEKSYPMHRLLQGDVGCGKTIVAAFALAVCVDCGWQAAVMVPTEVLAYQHHETLTTVLGSLGFTVKVLTSSLPRNKIKEIYSELEAGTIDVLVGTHALLHDEVKFNKLGLVVIDEQHKFGVAQRALLPKKGDTNPHCLVMSATPIPRTLALSLYGDLDISFIKTMPHGRIPPKNIWVFEEKRGWLYGFLKEQLSQGRQAYIVYPVIEDTEAEDLKSLEVMFKKIGQEFSSCRVGMFHGKMKSDEKINVIREFKEKQITILVSTTVIEVGVSIDNATVMVVENPERFGLAQLHQLRGRIQRSFFQPYFVLISKEDLSDTAKKRLEVISSTNDGFVIAEEDLLQRGPGDFFGSIQHGFPDLKIADPLRDLEILKQARAWAYTVVKKDPYLEQPYHRCIREHLAFWFQR